MFIGLSQRFSVSHATTSCVGPQLARTFWFHLCTYDFRRKHFLYSSPPAVLYSFLSACFKQDLNCFAFLLLRISDYILSSHYKRNKSAWASFRSTVLNAIAQRVHKILQEQEIELLIALIRLRRSFVISFKMFSISLFRNFSFFVFLYYYYYYFSLSPLHLV